MSENTSTEIILNWLSSTDEQLRVNLRQEVETGLPLSVVFGEVVYAPTMVESGLRRLLTESADGYDGIDWAAVREALLVD